jgi:hypothetical protein
MFQETRRPFTEAERAEIQSIVRGPPPHTFRGVGRGLFIAVVVTLVAAIVAPDRLLSWPAAVALGGAAGGITFVRARFRRREPPPWTRAFRVDLDAGIALVQLVRPREAIAVEESEDEGSQFLIGLTDGRGMFLVGQDLYGSEEERRFPCREFEVVFAPHSGHRLSLTCHGEYLAPKHRPEFRPEEFDDEELPRDGEMLSPDRYRKLGDGAS